MTAAAPVALTGATGFVGAAVCAALAAEGRRVRVLVRRPDRAGALPAGVDTVPGSLEDEGALAALTQGVGTVVHVAGLVAARRPEAFDSVNVQGTRRLMASVAKVSPPPRVLLMSSLAARRPDLSAYAASKRAAEAVVAAAGVEHCIVRPPAVYGPGDRATLPLFRQLSRGLIAAPRVPAGRFSLIHVDDLARLVAVLLDRPRWEGQVFEPDDGRDGGYAWADLAAIAGRELGKSVRCIQVPRAVVWCAALAQELAALVRGGAPMLSRGKIGELWYPDWVCNSESMREVAGWVPAVDFGEGFRRTRAWYRDRHWI